MQAQENILFISGRVKGEPTLKRYVNYEQDKDFTYNPNKANLHLRKHELIMNVAFSLGKHECVLAVLASKKFDCDRKKAKELLEQELKVLKVENYEIKEYKQVSQLTPKEFAQLQNPDSLAELSKPITFKNDHYLTLYAQGILLILSKLKRLAMVQTPDGRNEVKTLHKILESVIEKL